MTTGGLLGMCVCTRQVKCLHRMGCQFLTGYVCWYTFIFDRCLLTILKHISMKQLSSSISDMNYIILLEKRFSENFTCKLKNVSVHLYGFHVSSILIH